MRFGLRALHKLVAGEYHFFEQQFLRTEDEAGSALVGLVNSGLGFGDRRTRLGKLWHGHKNPPFFELSCYNRPCACAHIELHQTADRLFRRRSSRRCGLDVTQPFAVSMQYGSGASSVRGRTATLGRME
jgi:hypothetical protein